MSKKSWTILIIVIVVIIGVCVWSVYSPTMKSIPASNQNQALSGNDNGTAAMSATTNTSDTAINQDLQSIDLQLDGLDSDTANIETSLSSSTQSAQ